MQGGNADTHFQDQSVLDNIENLKGRPASYIDGNYTKMYLADAGAAGCDIWAYLHPNGLCLFGLVATHVAFRSFEPQSNSNLDSNPVQASISIEYHKVAGRDPTPINSNAKKMARKDGLWLDFETQLGNILVTPPKHPQTSGAEPGVQAGPTEDCANALVKSFPFFANIQGKILSCNPKLVADPDLIWRRPHDQAYLLIVALQESEERRVKGAMMSEEAFCASRQLKVSDLRCGTFEASDFARIHAALPNEAAE